MKIDDVIVAEQINEARPAGALSQLGRSIGSKALKRIAPDLAYNLAGKADLGATANKLYDEFSNYLGTQGKSRNQATSADIKSFFAQKNVKVPLTAIPINDKIFNTVVKKEFAQSQRYGNKPPTPQFVKSKFENYLNSQGKSFDQALSKDLKAFLSSEGIKLNLNSMPAGSEMFTKIARDAMSGKIPTGAGSSSASTGISAGSPAGGGSPSTPPSTASGSARAPRTRARSSAGASGSATGSSSAPSAAPSAATGSASSPSAKTVTLSDVRTMIKSLRKRDKLALFRELETELGLSASTPGSSSTPPAAAAAAPTAAPTPKRSAKSASKTKSTPTGAPATPAAGAPKPGAGAGKTVKKQAAASKPATGPGLRGRRAVKKP
jgi:hypothetical protein